MIAGSHPFDVSGITVYFKRALMDKNQYTTGDTAHIWIDISSDTDINCSLIISSMGENEESLALSLKKDIPNYYEFDYLLTGCNRGSNELYLSIMKDSTSLAGEVLYFDVDIPDTVSPQISILEGPTNTYSSSKSYEVKARIWDPDSNGTPIYDTLYYRLNSNGGYWQSILSHSVKADTHRYYIPSQSNGSHIQFHIIARDSFGNLARYPEVGEREFWVLSPMRPSWSSLGYTSDTTVFLIWKPPEELISYHCGLAGDTIFLGNTVVATRFIPQYLPGRLDKFGVKLSGIQPKQQGCFDFGSDTILVHLYQVEDSLPGNEIDSFPFVIDTSGWAEFCLPGILISGEGIFVGISGPANIGVLFDGFGKGTNTAVYSDGSWTLNTQGEALTQAYVSYIPDSKKGQSQILSFDIYRSQGDSNWIMIKSGLLDTSCIDTGIQENNGYAYGIQALFENPADSFFSPVKNIFIDLTPPTLDTVDITTAGADTLLITATFFDTSNILWDSLGYKTGDSIIVTSEDSLNGNEHFFHILFAADTLFYFLKASDSSYMGNYARYPDSGFYLWGNPSGFRGKDYPDSTYLARIPQISIARSIAVKYALSEKSKVSIVLYDVVGRRVETLLNREQKRGYYSIPLSLETKPQGIYFLRMTAGRYEKTLKLVKLL